MGTFVCSRCGETKELQRSGGTGYATNDAGDKICYACCGEIDAEYMLEHGEITLYFNHRRGAVENWPGTLMFHITNCNVGKHNIAGVQRHVYFNGPGGRKWWGLQVGDDSELCYCKRMTENE